MSYVSSHSKSSSWENTDSYLQTISDTSPQKQATTDIHAIYLQAAHDIIKDCCVSAASQHLMHHLLYLSHLGRVCAGQQSRYTISATSAHVCMPQSHQARLKEGCCYGAPWLWERCQEQAGNNLRATNQSGREIKAATTLLSASLLAPSSHMGSELPCMHAHQSAGGGLMFNLYKPSEDALQLYW